VIPVIGGYAVIEVHWLVLGAALWALLFALVGAGVRELVSRAADRDDEPGEPDADWLPSWVQPTQPEPLSGKRLREALGGAR